MSRVKRARNESGSAAEDGDVKLEAELQKAMNGQKWVELSAQMRDDEEGETQIHNFASRYVKESELSRAVLLRYCKEKGAVTEVDPTSDSG